MKTNDKESIKNSDPTPKIFLNPSYVKRLRKFCFDPREFRGDPNWDLEDIMREFVEGFRFLVNLKKEVTIFGSARLSQKSHWYAVARELGEKLAEEGYTVITGGGPGIMEAANRGAHASAVTNHRECSIGFDIILPAGERRNAYVERRMPFHYFFTRKVMLSASAQAYIFFPGGYGTIDEFTEILTLVQTEKMEKVPIICVGKEYWESFKKWMDQQMLEDEEKLIDRKDISLFHIVNSAEEAMKIVRVSKERVFF